MPADSKPLPIEHFRQGLLLQRTQASLFSRLMRWGFATIVVSSLIVSALILWPMWRVPRSPAFKEALRFLQSSRVLKRHLGPQYQIAQRPQRFLIRRPPNQPPVWVFETQISSRDGDSSVVLECVQEQSRWRVRKAYFRNWNLVTGRKSRR